MNTADPSAVVVNPRPPSGLHVSVAPEGVLDVLSRAEIARLQDGNQRELHERLRRCALAVLSTGLRSEQAASLSEVYPDFDLRVVSEEHGVRLELKNAPKEAFVDGALIRGIQEHLFAVLRDLVFHASVPVDGDNPEAITDAVFHRLRNARVLNTATASAVVVCWGGHAISREEYDYSKQVGYELGLRGLDICTGCGPGAMKGPMKGATIGHAKQRRSSGRYIGITEPGIISAEAPNALVNALVVMPDIEKRLEAFVRLGHAVIVFPGGVGTAEEVLYLLGILLHPDNSNVRVPLVMTGPAGSASYFQELDRFITSALGAKVRSLYRIVIDDPQAVGQQVRQAVEEVRVARADSNDPLYFNWRLKLAPSLQQPFEPSHARMRDLRLTRSAPLHELAADLRRAFSGIVAGNVKPEGIQAIIAHGPFEIQGEAALMASLDQLLQRFANEGRMKLKGDRYQACYRLSEAI